VSAVQLTDVRFIQATSAEAATGLLGYVSCTLNGVLRLDGLALRRTLSGALALSFPVRIDRAGRRHAYIRPLTNEARTTIEAQVFAALALQVEAAA
jgi:DNA-binding cell septation regulator SpoVG